MLSVLKLQHPCGYNCAIIDKIIQPFFTTKPTEQGIGLGLSLAYDIITKEHNVTIKPESQVDEGNPGNFA